MAQNTFITGESPAVNISVNGELFLKGWDRQEISTLPDHGHSLKIKQEGNTLNIFCLGDCELSIPTKAVVQVDRVGGEAEISDLAGSLTVLRVGGDLSLLRVSQVKIARVGGDLMVQQVQGGLALEKTGGDVVGRDLESAVQVDRAGGDITLQNISGPVSAHASGDLEAGFALLGDSHLRAGGDIGVHLPENANVTLKITSHGHDITLDVGVETESIEERYYEVTLGEGGPVLEMEAGGDVVITDKPWKKEVLDDFGRDFAERGMRFDRIITGAIRRGMRGVNAEQIAEQVARRSEEAARRAEQRLQSSMNRVEWSLGRRSRWDTMPGAPGVPVPPGSEPEAKPVTDEERLMVLRMVQEKKITIEEAEKLLRALEGRGE